ncbi:MAG TPA: isoleucine--tRNA ligase [Candidatus Binataceae bacterium]|nr:isoleucine--tRNA ligase [Candidatus Binataceae bacterium]
MRGNLPVREPEILARWDQMDFYGSLLESRKQAPLYVLHDGPPYANGEVHIGTALNKILKDFIVRSRAVMGFRTPYVPGWDCHGMPIEHQVSRALGAKARSMSKLELRKLCRAHAEKFIEVQRTQFRRLGVIGDWNHPYLTFSPEYDAAEIGVLRQLVEDGYVYRGLRPVHWCFDCRTALAEAEVEYHEHVSPSIYVAFTMNDKVGDAGALAANAADAAALAAAHAAGKLSAVIWTTTPWTLPANLGISLNPSADYVALKVGDKYYIAAERLAEAFAKTAELAVASRVALDREALKALDGKDIFRHPFMPRDGKLMFGDHVTLETGTGLVHTAPGHGYEDFVIGEAYGLPTLTPVDAGGTFTAEAGKYAGQQVFKANDVITRDLAELGVLVHGHKVGHSYPHCWRCKNPLIFRATEQWFLRIDHKQLRERALGEIEKVQWLPRWSRDRIKNMVETRPDWCLSRQRVWGVPIPALRCAGCGDVRLEIAVLKRAEEIFAREGSDAWYVRPVADFAASDLRCGKCGGQRFEKTEDILDVWFDSGCSHAAVLATRPDLSWPSDLYIEGVDQHRGWFQVSLITATATRNAAPFRTVITNGLALDELGRKMSKSLGNVENAVDVVKRIGADVMRLVFASVDYSADMNIGETVFATVVESYRKLRNTCRYFLGNLFDFDPSRAVPYAEMLEFDRYVLARTERLKHDLRRAYEEYDFQAAYNLLLNFAVIDLSSLYVDVVRDRLYCSGADSRERRSAQTALYEILNALVRMLAPLIPYTADEVYSHMPGKHAASVHLLELAPANPQWADQALEARWERLLEVRSEALKLLEAMRQAGTIGAPLEAKLMLGVAGPGSDGLGQELRGYRDQLKELFIVSDLSILDDADAAKMAREANGQETFSVNGAYGRLTAKPPVLVIGERARGRKCQRCWMYFDDGADSDLDPRCRAVLQAGADGPS